MKYEINNGIKLDLGKISVEGLYSAEFEEGRKSYSAHLSQDRSVTYPAANLGTGFGKGLFENPEGETFKQTRHCLVVIPEGADEDTVKAKLEEFEKSCLYRVVSNNVEDVIGEKVSNAIEQGFTDLESQKPKFVVRDSEGNIYATFTKDGKVLAEEARKVGKIVTDEKGKAVDMDILNPEAVLEYSTTIFSREFKTDEDLREFKQTSNEVEVRQETAEIQS